MKRYIEGVDRTELCFPERFDDYIEADNPVRVVEVFIEGLDLAALGFARVQPPDTGRPAYHPATLLKLYVYGYLNRIPSSRRLERECQRNVELMWLIGRLMPDFKTIADFRKDNGSAIRQVCREFVRICRGLGLFNAAIVAIDGSKFKAVNNRDRNFTPAKMTARLERLDRHINRYLAELDNVDPHALGETDASVARLNERIATLKAEQQRLTGLEQRMRLMPDQQLSLTDPDARSMATSAKGSAIIGYNVQTAVESEHHLMVAHEVTNVVHDRSQLFTMAEQAREAMGQQTLTGVADKGYYSGEQIVACEQAGITVFVPKPQTSGSKKHGRFGKQDFQYDREHDRYRCPAGQWLTRRASTVENGQTLYNYRSTVMQCGGCALKAQCTPIKARRIRRWEHEDVLDAMQVRLDNRPQMMGLRRQTVEHPFGTVKAWMGATHFLTTKLTGVSTEMSLQVLSYNLKRVMNILGVGTLLEALAT